MKQFREAEERKLENQFDNERIKASKIAMLVERSVERQAQDYRRQLLRENMLLAKDQKAFQKYLNEEVSKRLHHFQI